MQIPGDVRPAHEYEDVVGVRARLPTYLGRPHWRAEVRLLPAAAMRTEETQHVAFLQVSQPADL